MLFSGYFLYLMCLSTVLSGDYSTKPVKRPPPKLEITQNGNYLYFHASHPNSSVPHCWKYVFQYRKCNEGPKTVNATDNEQWIAKVEYDAACKYTVQVQAKYDTMYCGLNVLDSDMSNPVPYGQDYDPNFQFNVAVIAIPLIVGSCLIFAILLFRRHKDTFFPKVPSPSHFFTDMYGSNTEITKYLYVPNEEVVEVLHVEPVTAHQPNE